jgi:transcriptional regulator with XRE-family HTH domain
MIGVTSKTGPTNGVGSFSRDAFTVQELKAFAKLLCVYLSRDEEDRQGIASMASIAVDADSTDDEIEAALETLGEGLYPTEAVDLSVDLDQEPDEQCVSKQMDSEEETFAKRLAHYMKSKKMSQVELAAAIGVGQPAISMMLSRNCRPQRRTVECIALALEVAPNDLWPGFRSPDNTQIGASAPNLSNAVLPTGVGRFDFLVSSGEAERISSLTKTRIRADALEDWPFPSDHTPRPVAA